MIATQQSVPLHLDGVGTGYGGAWAVRGVTVTVPAGGVLAVLGPSGCGKSTLLRLVAGLERPEEGEIRLGDRLLSSPRDVVAPERRDVSLVFQDYALWPHLRVAEIIGYGLRHGIHRVDRATRRARVSELIRFLRLDGLELRRPAELSGGQRQRVAIARALATRPRLLLFDEPLSNLDSQLRGEMRDELGSLLATLGTTSLYVTHDVGEALALADRILVLHEGKVIQHAAPQDVFASPASGWVASLAGFSSRLSIAALHVDGEEARAAVAGGSLTGRYCGADVRAGEWSAYVHPDAVRLDDRPDAMRGVVVSSVYEGRRHRLRVDLGAVGSLVLAAGSKHAVGEQVGLAVDPDGVLLFGAPAGLARHSTGDFDPGLGSARVDQDQAQHSDERHRDALLR